MALDSVLAIGTLFVCVSVLGIPFTGPYLLLALIVFSLTFPARAPRGTSAGAVAREVLSGWILLVALLLVLGWATRTLDAFDARAITAWVATAPVVMFTGHLLM